MTRDVVPPTAAPIWPVNWPPPHSPEPAHSSGRHLDSGLGPPTARTQRAARAAKGRIRNSLLAMATCRMRGPPFTCASCPARSPSSSPFQSRPCPYSAWPPAPPPRVARPPPPRLAPLASRACRGWSASRCRRRTGPCRKRRPRRRAPARWWPRSSLHRHPGRTSTLHRPGAPAASRPERWRAAACAQ
eukprot:scaffold2085_cov99-Isochrysis_galbana.AAC.2